MHEVERPYLTFLLRLWRVKDAPGQLWRASLVSSETAERYGFATLDALFAFVFDLTSGSAEPESSPQRAVPRSDT